ncbi:proline-rich transmembrane protein 1 isoform X1 [Hydra vulgaris]|uniref:proline-rich transmembrane protein 1 isoform X1 n=1 Tax=Hydra vulgaris TaxID=6087 RepID=UPI001F5F3D54|nr:proline-rich transmembrane protein 1 [Hydra vulgaris]
MDIIRTHGQKSKNISHQQIPKGSTLSIISENLQSSSLDHQSAESKKPPICVKNYMGLAIFSLVCFFPIGTLALYNSRQVAFNLARKEPFKAEKHSLAARNLAFCSIYFGFIALFIFVVNLCIFVLHFRLAII